ncbi:MAG: SDR family NAD(P)-dependent oxidoreductase [Fimbriimonadaceae bacterium]
MSETVLVTGGAGFIGSHLCEALVKQGRKVLVLDDLSNGFRENISPLEAQIEFIEGSITDNDLVDELVSRAKVVFHMAAISSVPKTIYEPEIGHSVNATGTFNIIEACRNSGAHMVYSSSAAVYGDTPEHPKTENSNKEPISPYAGQKFIGEIYLQSLAKEGGFAGVSLRYFNVFGPRQRADSPYSGVISVFSDRAKAGEPIRIQGDGLQTRDFVSVHDVVRANLLAAEARHLKGEPFNIAGGTETTIRELAETIVRITSSNSQIEHIDARPGDIRYSRANVSHAKSELGFEAQVSLEEGLSELLSE